MNKYRNEGATANTLFLKRRRFRAVLHLQNYYTDCMEFLYTPNPFSPMINIGR